MNWIFYDSDVKPKHLEECFAIESRERQIESCYWNDREKQFYSYDYDKHGKIFYLGPFEDYKRLHGNEIKTEREVTFIHERREYDRITV